MRRFLPLLALLPALAAGFFWWRSEQGRLAALDRVAQLEASRDLHLPSPAAPPPISGSPAEPAPPAAGPPKTARTPSGADPSQYLGTIDELRDQMNHQSRELSAARDAAARAEASHASIESELKKLRAQLDDLREEGSAARRVAEALQVELRTKSERLLKAETAEKIMEARLKKAEASAAGVAQTATQLDDLHRRREALFVTLLRRYREVNDLYRNFTLNTQTRETSGGGLQAGDLSRIQSAIQQAEDDLRQVQSLNARIAQLARAK